MYGQTSPLQDAVGNLNAIISQGTSSVLRVIDVGFSGQDVIRAEYGPWIWRVGLPIVFEPPRNLWGYLTGLNPVINPSVREVNLKTELSSYVNAVAGSREDLDFDLEAASVEHLLLDKPDEE